MPGEIGGGGRLTDRVSEALLVLLLKDRVLTAPPRLVSDRSMNTWHLYVDAAYEDGKAGVGGILTTASGTRVGYFSESLDTATLEVINQRGSKKPI